MYSFEDKVREFQEASDKLYNSDIVYKTLVDNYCKARNPEDVSNAINALHKYKDKLHRENVLVLFKHINITDEDLRDMAVEGILDAKTLKAIFQFKGFIKKEDK